MAQPLLTQPTQLPIKPLDCKPQTPNLSFPKPSPSQKQHNPKPLHHANIISKNVNTHLSFLNRPIDSYTTKQVHAQAIKNGFHGHEFVETKLLYMYGKHGCIDEAIYLFDRMPDRNLHSWIAMLRVYLDNGYSVEALHLFLELQFEDYELEFRLFPVVLRICSGCGGHDFGRQLHGMVIKNGFSSNVYVGNALIDMYGKCGSLADANKVLIELKERRDCVSWNSMITSCVANGMVHEALKNLEKMCVEDNLTPNYVTWNVIIGGFAQNGYDHEAVEMLYRMEEEGFEPNARTLAGVLPACARLGSLGLGKQIHGYAMRRGLMSNPFVVNGLIDVYRRCRDMDSAFNVFSVFSLKNEVSSNTIIAGYCENGQIEKARRTFDQMQLEGAVKDIISWNSMILGYVNNLNFEEALNLFRDLVVRDGVEADSYTLGSILAACAEIGSLRCGKAIHSRAIVRNLQSDPFVGTALVQMYCKCQDLEAAQKTFDEVEEKDAAIWNALISGYARCNQTEYSRTTLQKMKTDGLEPDAYTWNGVIAGLVENDNNESALKMFSERQDSNFRPDIYTVGLLLLACSKLASIERGKQVHAHAIRCGYESGSYIGASLVDMYAKCGSIKHARLVHNQIQDYNLVTENAMLTAFAMHGRGEEGIAFFRKMLLAGFQLDNVTFLSVLSSCVHAGSVKEGREFFNLMRQYNVKATLKHYTCMVDLLSRTGQLVEAYNIIKNMPMAPDSVTWGALLGGCMIHRNVDMGEVAASKLIELEPDNAGNYVMLANLYASVGRWCDVARTREAIDHKQIYKNPGCSCIEDKDGIHVFVAYDESHEKAIEINSTLDCLRTHMTDDSSTRGHLMLLNVIF